jgi:hypothetical protein
MYGMTNFKVVRTEQITPKTVASVVVSEESFGWVVRCEGDGCDLAIGVNRKVFRPVDYANRDAGHVAEVLTAPSARYCVECGAKRFIPNYPKS